VGPDGAIWFSDPGTGQIGRITVPGVTPREYVSRFIPMGVSIGNTSGVKEKAPRDVGTSGLLVHSNGAEFILSANHVIGTAGPGTCPGTAVPGTTWTLQPGTGDIGFDPGDNPKFYVGTVARYVPLSTSQPNLVDAAISVTSSSLATSAILGLGVPSSTIASPSKYEGVVKSGRTSGVTIGTVIMANITATVIVHEGPPPPYPQCGNYPFQHQIMIFGVSPGPFSKSGDSGAAVLDATSLAPVGLIMAGTPNYSLANPITDVLLLLDVLPDGSGTTSPSVRLSDDPRYQLLQGIQARHEREILSLPGVQGIGIGFDENDLVLKILVTKLTPEIAQTLPSELEGAPLKVLETGGEFVFQ